MKQTYTFRFDTKLHSLLKSNAAKEGVSMSNYIEAIMLLAMKKKVTVDPATRDEVLEQVVADMPVINESETAGAVEAAALDTQLDTQPAKETPEQFY